MSFDPYCETCRSASPAASYPCTRLRGMVAAVSARIISAAGLAVGIKAPLARYRRCHREETHG